MNEIDWKTRCCDAIDHLRAQHEIWNDDDHFDRAVCDFCDNVSEDDYPTGIVHDEKCIVGQLLKILDP